MTENLVNPTWPHNKDFTELAPGLMVPTHPLGDPVLTYVKTFKVTSNAVLFCLKAADNLWLPLFTSLNLWIYYIAILWGLNRI